MSEPTASIVYLRAVRIMQGAAPKPSARRPGARASPGTAEAPPVVVFALPLDGEVDVPPSSRFVVQFSKDMDEATFKGRVVLRYLGRHDARATANSTASRSPTTGAAAP